MSAQETLGLAWAVAMLLELLVLLCLGSDGPRR